MKNRSRSNELIAMELGIKRQHICEFEAFEEKHTRTTGILTEPEEGKVSDRNGMLSFHYVFTFSDGLKKEFDIRLDPVTLNFISTGRQSTPEWAVLEYAKCEICPLDSSQFKFCPVAVGLTELVDSFKDMISYQKVDISLISNGRNVWKHTSIQEGISSLLCIYMVTNGCPIMETLKPMVRYHLPFASLEETNYHVTSMYLLGQYFLKKKGLEPDWEFQGLTDIYENIRLVNKGMYKRLQNVSNGDAIVNAIAHMDIFACSLPYLIEDSLKEIEYLFSAYQADSASKGNTKDEKY